MPVWCLSWWLCITIPCAGAGFAWSSICWCLQWSSGSFASVYTPGCLCISIICLVWLDQMDKWMNCNSVMILFFDLLELEGCQTLAHTEPYGWWCMCWTWWLRVEVTLAALWCCHGGSPPLCGWWWLGECITGQSLVGFLVIFAVDKQNRHHLVYLSDGLASYGCVL